MKQEIQVNVEDSSSVSSCEYPEFIAIMMLNLRFKLFSLYYTKHYKPVQNFY